MDNKKIDKVLKIILVVITVITAIIIIYINLNKEEREFNVFDDIVNNFSDNNNDKNNNNDKLSDIVSFDRSVDGDTAVFLINNKLQKVRFLAIDTPESVKENTKVEDYAIEASNYTKNLLKNAKEIKLEYEKVNDYDKYDRLLAWVFVDGKLLQEELIKQGLAKVAYIYEDYKYTDRLYEAQNKAKSDKVGIWK